MRWFKVLVPGLAMLLVAAQPIGAQPNTGVQLQSQVWSGALVGAKGHADCKIQTADGLNCKIFVDATGLVPKGSYTLWSDAGGNMLPITKDVDPLVADRKGALRKSSLLNSCPSDKEVHVILRQETGAGRYVVALDGTLKKQ